MTLTKKEASNGDTFYTMQLLGNAGKVLVFESKSTSNSWIYSWDKGEGSVEASSSEEARTLIINQIVGLK